MSIKLSDRIQRVKPSQTLAITATAARLRAEGKDIIGLGAGEPDFPTPAHIRQAGIDAINNGQTRYTAVDGTAEVKEAIINKFERDNGLSYSAEQILVSSGGKQSSFNLYQALLNDGDEIIIPAPYWVSYPDMALLAGAVPVIVSAGQDQGFKLHPDQLREAITDKTRLVVLNSPSNPTGVAYSEEELTALAEVLLPHPNILIATDDMYEHILFEGRKFSNIVMVCPELYDRTIVLNGVSKAYAMTGWRIGYAGGPVEIVKAMKKVQGQSTSNPCTISQAATVAALNGDQTCITDMLKAFGERHNYVYKTLDQMDGLHCLPSDGTFYSFPDCREVVARMDGINDDVELAAYLLEKAEVAVVPGTAFGAPGHFRVSYATSMENLQEALTRIKGAIS
ncbi:MAG: pyridoxal phosphate-dependent aminotransferase [bacterium]